MRLLRVASRVEVAPLAARGANSIIHGDNHNKQEYGRHWHCPELEHCSRKDHHCREQGSLAPSVPPPSPLHSTSTRSSQCPAGLYLPALFALDDKMHAHTCTGMRTRASTPPRATGNKAPVHTRTRALGREGHSRMRRWVRRHGGHESSGDQRRKHRSDGHRPAANAKQKQKQKAKAQLPLT